MELMKENKGMRKVKWRMRRGCGYRKESDGWREREMEREIISRRIGCL